MPFGKEEVLTLYICDEDRSDYDRKARTNVLNRENVLSARPLECSRCIKNESRSCSWGGIHVRYTLSYIRDRSQLDDVRQPHFPQEVRADCERDPRGEHSFLLVQLWLVRSEDTLLIDCL